MDPVLTYLETFESLRKRKRWGQDERVLRLAALVLSSAGARGTTELLETTAETLRKRAGWTSPIVGEVRYMVAAMVLRRGLDPVAIYDRVEEVRAGFRERKMRRGGVREALAALLLALRAEGRPVPNRWIDRMREVWLRWKEDHPWLTQYDDYPMAALHASTAEDVGVLAARTEQIYGGLHGEGFSRGNPLQLASQALAIAPREARESVRRFTSLVRAFENRGERIGQSRFDEVALLSLTPSDPGKLAQEVCSIRDRLREARPRPDKEIAFSIAVGIALASDEQRAGTLREARDLAAATAAQAVIEAQQAALIACTVAATSAATHG